MVLDFPADQVSIERPQGSESLFFRFDDGSSIELQNFYTQFNKDDIPSFEVDGQLIAGADFFNAFGPDLAPAAGPAASPTRGGGYNEYSSSSLETGVAHLGALDYRLAFSGETDTRLDDTGTLFTSNSAPTLTSGGAPMEIALKESAWDGVSTAATPVVSQSGSFSVSDPDGDSLTSTVSMGGKVIAVSTSGPTTVESDYGTLVITPQGGGSNITFDYTYTLKQDAYSTTDSLAQDEVHTDSIVFSISDGQGNTVTQPINVVITGSNDAPDITSVSAPLTLKEDGVYANETVGNTLHPEELNNASGVQATLSGTISAHDPDNGAQLYYAFKDMNGNLLDMSNVNGDGSLKGAFVIGSVSNPDGSTSDVLVTGISEQGGNIVINTNYGDLVLEEGGGASANYTFTLTNTTGEGATNKLAEGQTVTLNLEPYVRDEYGAEDGSSGTTRDGTVAGNGIVITILGTNDAPTISQNAWNNPDANNPLSVTVHEASDSTTNSTLTGAILGHDVDNGDSLHYGLVQVGGDTMYSKVYVVLGADGQTLTTTTDAPTAGTAGNYVGEFVLTEDADPAKGASYTFTLYNDSPAVQGMQEGDSRDVSIGLVARDSFGAYVQETVSVTIKGANDTPVISTSPTLVDLTVVEAGVKNVQGDPNEAFAGTPTDTDAGHSFTVTDVDNSDTQGVSIVAKDSSGATVGSSATANGDGTYTVTTPEGSFTLTPGAAVANDSGSSKTYTYSYALDNSDADTQALNEGETRTYTFTVTITDSKGAQVEQAINLTITGTNDKPALALAAPTVAAFTEDSGSYLSSGTFTVADVDADGAFKGTTGGQANQAYSIAGGTTGTETTTGTANVDAAGVATYKTDYGTLTVKPDGTYTYVLDNDSSKVQSLGAGQSHVETFAVTVTDLHGANDTQTISFTINGTNDKPVIGTSVTAVDVVETGVQGSHDAAHPNAAYAGTPSATGNVSATDVDNNDAGGLTFSVAAGAGTTVDSTGTNTSTTVTTSYGTIVIDSLTGSYTYTLNNTKADALNENQKVTETFVVTVADGHGASVTQPVTVTITGTNDRPDLTLGTPSTTTFTEDSGSYSASGSFTVADIDADGAFKGTTSGHANQTYSIAGGTTGTETTTGSASVSSTGIATYVTNYGTLTVNPDGTYNYVMNNASNTVQNMSAGQTHTETFNVTVTDLHGSTDVETITFKIIGTNDQPTISSANGTLTLKEQGLSSLTDPAHTGTVSSIPGYNNVAVNGLKVNDGTYAVKTGSFAVTDMDTNDTLKATLSSGSVTLNKYDGTTSTSTGANVSSLPVLSGAGTWTVNDAYGTLTVTGVRTVNANGSETITYSYSYNVNQSLSNSLAEGETANLNYTISVTDGTGTPVAHAIAINVQGTNDSPGIKSQTLTLKDDGLLDGGDVAMASGTGTPTGHGSSYKASVEGTLTGTDVDHGTTLTFSLINTQLGTDAYKHLGTDSGELAEGTVTGAYLKDGASSSSGVIADMVVSTGTYPGGGTATIINVYANSTHTADNQYGTLYLDESTGKFTFVLATDSSVVNALGSGEKLTLYFKGVVVDEHNASSSAINVPIVIYGTNDKPVLTLADNALSVTDGGPTSDTALAGSVTVTDVDVNDTHTFGIVSNSVTEGGTTPTMSSSAAGSYGTLTIDQQTGEYTYTLAKNNAAVIKLDVGETLTETFQVAVKDNYGGYSLQTVTVTINGKEDLTVINTGWLTPSNGIVEAGVNPVTSAAAAADAAKLQDGSAGVRTATGYIGAHDVDTSDNTALASTAESANLHYVIQVGTVQCDLNALFAGNGLQAGTASIDADGKLTLAGGAASTLAVGQAATDASGNIIIKLENGTLTISKDSSHSDANGSSLFKYVYTLDNTDLDVQTKNFGESAQDSFSLVIHDTQAGTDIASAPVSITIQGTNDRPIIVQAPVVALSESDAHSTSGQITLLDYEQTGGTAQTVSSGFTFSLVASADATSGDSPVMQGLYGRLVLDQTTGKYTYHRTADLSALNDEGGQLTETFYVRVMDKDGAYSETQAITVAITGENSAGVLGSNVVYVKEDGVVTVPGQSTLYYSATDKLGNNAAQPLLPSSGVISGHLSVTDADTNLGSGGQTLVAGGTPDTYTAYSYGTASAVFGLTALTCNLDSSTVVNGLVTDATYTIAGYGTLSVHSDGSYEFAAAKSGTELAPDLNALAQGESVTITIPAATHSDADSSETVTGTVTITINGTNDAPVVSIDSTGLTNTGLTTLQSTDVAMNMLAADVDLATEFVQTYAPGSLQEFTDWLTQHPDHQGLLNELLKIYPDAESTAVAFLNAKYGSAILVDTEVAQWSNKDGGDLVVDGNLHNAAIVTDVDHGSSMKFFTIEGGGESGNLSQALAGKYGTLVVQPDGTYQYVLDRNSEGYQDLCQGDPHGTATETFTIYVRDEYNTVADQPITLVINVAATPGGGSGGTTIDVPLTDATSEVYEDGVTTATGTIATNTGNTTYDTDIYLSGKYDTHDSDGADSTHAATRNTSTVATDYGTLTLLPDGTYTFTLNNDSPNVQSLHEGETITQTFEVVGGGGATSSITITIHGTNDTPYVISQSDTVALHQDAGSTTWVDDDATGSFTVGDVDKDDVSNLTLVGATAAPTGASYDYTVTGSLGGTFYIKDNGNGTYSYTYAGPTGNYVGSGTDKIVLTVTDPYNASTTVTLSAALNASNDAPTNVVTTTDSVLTVTEDGGSAGLVASGKLTATDTDISLTNNSLDQDNLSFAIVNGGGTASMLQGTYGTLLLDADGTYSYHLNNSLASVQALGAGATANDVFTVQVSDGRGGTTTVQLSINVDGTNDAPIITLLADGSTVAGSGTTLSLTDGQADLTVKGTAVTYDIDAGDQLTLNLNGQAIATGSTSVTEDVYAYKDATGWHVGTSASTGAVLMGVLQLNADGTYSFAGDKDGIDHLAQGDALDISAVIGVSDQNGATNSANVSIAITGTNDAPVITAFTDTTLTDNGSTTQTLSGTIPATDADGDTMTYYILSGGQYVTQLHDGHGTLQLVGNTYTYTLDADYVESLKALGQDVETAGGTFTIVAVDKYGATGTQDLDVSLKGVNDAPTFTAPTLSIVDGASPLTGSLGAVDVDTNDAGLLTYSAALASSTASTGQFGQLTIDASGNYSYTLTNHELGVGATGQEVYTITVSDGHGGTVSHDVTVNITGANDVPVASLDVTNHVLSATDVDLGDTLAFAVNSQTLDATAGHATDVAGTFGTLTFTADSAQDDTFSYGNYTLDTSYSSISNLAQLHDAGTALKDTFSYAVSDNHSGQATGTIDVSIDANNWDGSGGHLLFGTSGNDTLDSSTLTGNSILFGGDGNDLLTGGVGDDILYGGAGQNHLYGGDGSDYLYAGNSGDHLYGGAGNDHLYGGSGNDFLDGGANTFAADGGGNELFGGAGNDVLVFHQGDTIDGDSGLNVLISGGSESLDTLLGSGNVSHVDVLVQDAGTASGDATSSLTSLTALSNVGINMGGQAADGSHSITLDSTQWTTVDGGHSFTNATADLTITTTSSVQVTDPTAEQQQFVLKVSS